MAVQTVLHEGRIADAVARLLGGVGEAGVGSERDQGGFAGSDGEIVVGREGKSLDLLSGVEGEILYWVAVEGVDLNCLRRGLEGIDAHAIADGNDRTR